MNVFCQVVLMSVLFSAQARAADSIEAISAKGAAEFPAAMAVRLERASDYEIDTQFALLENPDPAVRAQAAKALRPYVLNVGVQERLSVMLADSLEPDLVRRAVLKSLAWGVSSEPVVRSMAACAQDANNSTELRNTAYRALYAQANRKAVQDLLLKALKEDPQPILRKAAAWALFFAIREGAVKKALLETAGRSENPAELRVEALKTLFDLIPDPEVVEAVRGLAADPAQSADVRETAILCLVLAKKDGATLELLQRLSGPEQDERLRLAAVAASGPMNIKLDRYFQWTRWHHQFLDPLAGI